MVHSKLEYGSQKKNNNLPQKTEKNRNNKKFSDTVVNENFKTENGRRRNILTP